MSAYCVQVAATDVTGLLLVLLGLAVGAGVGYAIGKPKGLETLGLILGACLGILGWIVVAVMQPAPHMRRGGRSRLTFRTSREAFG